MIAYRPHLSIALPQALRHGSFQLRNGRRTSSSCQLSARAELAEVPVGRQLFKMTVPVLPGIADRA
jgi:hypothetical protein